MAVQAEDVRILPERELLPLGQRMSMPLLPEPTAQDRVALGVAYLDGRLPGWREHMRKPVDISHANRCVLAQVGLHDTRVSYAPGGTLFESTVEFLGLTEAVTEEFGFLNRKGRRGDYTALTVAWRAELNQKPMRRLVRLFHWGLR
jgi:hypothetical protein